MEHAVAGHQFQTLCPARRCERRVVQIAAVPFPKGAGIRSTVAEAVAKGSKVSIPGWVSFEQVATSARTGRNPQTGEEIKIPAGKRVKVSAGAKLKAAAK